MPNFESGVSRYIDGYATIVVHFPVDRRGCADISCSQCPYYSRSSRICQLNKHVPAYPDKFVGQECPLITKEDINE